MPAAAPPPHARHYAANHLHYTEHPASHAVPPVPSQEPAVTRGRASTTNSARGPPSRGPTPAPPIPKLVATQEVGLERKQSQSYGHHRQTSIVHGIQHSRNQSFVNSTTTSPINPQAIAAAGANSVISPDGRALPQDEILELPTMTGVQPLPNGNLSGDTRITDGLTTAGGIRKPERAQSGRTKRDASHNRSQSRHGHHHQQDLKTVGEYALHHLFNSVSSTT